MSLEQRLQLTNTSLESEKSHCKSQGDEIQSKTQTLLAVQQELDELKEQLAVASKKTEESNNHIKILATSCNESKMIIAAKEKVL